MRPAVAHGALLFQGTGLLVRDLAALEQAAYQRFRKEFLPELLVPDLLRQQSQGLRLSHSSPKTLRHLARSASSCGSNSGASLSEKPSMNSPR
jgi:hypothetical protein